MKITKGGCTCKRKSLIIAVRPILKCCCCKISIAFGGTSDGVTIRNTFYSRNTLKYVLTVLIPSYICINV